MSTLGINYSINARTFECKAKPLGNRTWDAKETDDHHHIRMRTATEFWGLDHPDYIYEGYRDVRGVPADIFARKSPSRRRPGSFVSYDLMTFLLCVPLFIKANKSICGILLLKVVRSGSWILMEYSVRPDPLFIRRKGLPNKYCKLATVAQLIISYCFNPLFQ